MGALLAVVLAVHAPDVAFEERSARLFHPGEAPLQSGSSLAVSAFTATTGMALMFAAGARFAMGSAGPGASWVMFGLGMLAFNFGPNLADLLCGNGGHMLERGLLRFGLLLGSVVLTALGPLGALGVLTCFSAWFAWCIADIIDANRAPQRWAAKMNGEPKPPLFPILRF